MEDRLDVVPVRVNDERCVIPGVVMRAKTRRAVVAAAGFDSGAVELVDGGSVGCGEGHMNGSGRGIPFLDPEISTALDGEPRPPRALHYLHSERLEGLLVEGAAASLVTYSQGQVVDEGKQRHGQRYALYLKARPPGDIPEHWAGQRAFTSRLAKLGALYELPGSAAFARPMISRSRSVLSIAKITRAPTATLKIVTAAYWPMLNARPRTTLKTFRSGSGDPVEIPSNHSEFEQ